MQPSESIKPRCRRNNASLWTTNRQTPWQRLCLYASSSCETHRFRFEPFEQQQKTHHTNGVQCMDSMSSGICCCCAVHHLFLSDLVFSKLVDAFTLRECWVLYLEEACVWVRAKWFDAKRNLPRAKCNGLEFATITFCEKCFVSWMERAIAFSSENWFVGAK